MNKLAEVNHSRRAQVEDFRDRLVAIHENSTFSRLTDSPLPKLKKRITEALSTRWGHEQLEPRFELIERERYGGDITIKFPQLLRDGGPKTFASKHVPWIVEVLSGEDFTNEITRVETTGMYINLTLSDRWLLDSAQSVADSGDCFGRNDAMRSRTTVVDYSSPNVAKTLHAGHIRSTIVGHVLSNLYEACGALVYRINHVNDFGGFGFVLEGHRRFANQFPVTLDDNGRLLEIYRIRRILERAVKNSKSLDGLDADERETMARYFPNATCTDDLTFQFNDFTVAADARFAALEAGQSGEVELWRTLVAYSLAAFNIFYESLNIHFDLIIGESFYFNAGDTLVDECLESGKAAIYTKAQAADDILALDERYATGELTEAERSNFSRLITKDIGAVVIPIDRSERLIVRRADGRSIYATRDLGAILLRREIFNPTDIVYVVGQEQQVHFDRLFRAAYSIGLASPEKLRFEHLYFGFYVDAKTGKKLSSRDSVSSVTHLLSAAIAHFRASLSGRKSGTGPELEKTARELAVGSLVFNDLKNDIRGPVEIDGTNINATIAGFEKSGGAYVIYAAVRAGSILRRHGETPIHASQVHEFSLDDQEVALLLKLQQVPEVVVTAAQRTDPSILVRHLLDIASVYNSYYARVPVITDGVASPSRLLITQAVQQTLKSGLALCHVECPDAI